MNRVNRASRDWVPHPADDLDKDKLNEVTKKRHVYVRLRDKSPEAQADSKLIKKLYRIRRLEGEATGEEPW